MDLNELRARKEKIGVYLADQGWDVANCASVIPEVDTKQSDFLAHSYKTVAETLKSDLESKYVDYLLLDGLGATLVIVEAKRTSKDPLIGQRQAEQYADDIKRQTGKDVFIFLSNGYEIWFWDRERYPLRQLKGFYAQKDLERLRFLKCRRRSHTLRHRRGCRSAPLTTTHQRGRPVSSIPDTSSLFSSDLSLIRDFLQTGTPASS